MEEALIQFIQEPNVVLTGTSEECFLELSKENYDVEQFVEVIDGNKQRKQNGNLYCSV